MHASDFLLGEFFISCATVHCTQHTIMHVFMMSFISTGAPVISKLLNSCKENGMDGWRSKGESNCTSVCALFHTHMHIVG